MKLGPGTFFRSVTEKELTDCTLLQIHNAPELAAFCEGFFLKHMSSLLEQDSFRQLIYSRNSKVQGLDPLRDLQTALAGRLHSVYVTSRVWSRNKAVAEALVQTAQGHGLKQSWGFPVCLLESSVLAGSPLQQKPHRRGGVPRPTEGGELASLCYYCQSYTVWAVWSRTGDASKEPQLKRSMLPFKQSTMQACREVRQFT